MSSGPATPTYVLRGHNSPVHNLLFFCENALLASGDADGWLIVWSITSKRPVAVWKAHDGGVTGIRVWKGNRLLTHGRDHKLRVWSVDVGTGSASDLSIRTPADGAVDSQPKPWLLHAMDVSALNFCSFAVCAASRHGDGNDDDELWIASPNALDSGGVDIFHLPSEKRVLQLHSQKDRNTGMVMSLALSSSSPPRVCLMSGYEDGHVMIHYHDMQESSSSNSSWLNVMDCKTHSQPVLALDVSPVEASFFTSSADAVIAKFRVLPPAGGGVVGDDDSAFKTSNNTKHAGQQGLSVRSDGKVFATAGWDARVRVYSCQTLKELAVLKWHKDGCSSTAFATVIDGRQMTKPDADGTTALATRPGTSLEKIKHERSLKAQRTHWLAVGGKDAKISLWDIY